MKVIIEMPEGSTDKIEIKDGTATIDRVLDRQVPANYGFVPDTKAEDGDPLDVFVVSNKYLKTFDEIEVTILGMFLCTDQGIQDNKLFGIISNEKIQVNILQYMADIGDYLMNYKEGFKVLGYKEFKNKVEFLEYIEDYAV